MDQFSESTAQDIYQKLLDEIGDAYATGDFDRFRELVHIPHKFSTDAEEVVIESVTEMERSFHNFLDYLNGLGVTDFVRKCSGAAFLEPTKIMGSHISDLIRNATRIREPYEVWSSLELIDGKWKVTGSQNAITNTSWQAITFSHGKLGR